MTDERQPSDLYSIRFPGGGGTDNENMVVEAPTETSVIKMLIKHLNISLSRATPREVMDLYESGAGVVRIDAKGDQIFKDGPLKDPTRAKPEK